MAANYKEVLRKSKISFFKNNEINYGDYENNAEFKIEFQIVPNDRFK